MSLPPIPGASAAPAGQPSDASAIPLKYDTRGDGASLIGGGVPRILTAADSGKAATAAGVTTASPMRSSRKDRREAAARRRGLDVRHRWVAQHSAELLGLGVASEVEDAIKQPAARQLLDSFFAGGGGCPEALYVMY